MNILLIRVGSPEDPLNGCDLRIWNLLGKGTADVLCFDVKQRGENGKPISNKYKWKNTEIIHLKKNIESIKYQDVIISNFIKRNEEALTKIQNKVQIFIENNENPIIIASGHEIGLLLSSFLPNQFIFEANADSKSLYFERRFQNLASKTMLKKVNSKYLSFVYRQVENYITANCLLTIVPSNIDKQWILGGNPKANVLAIGNGTPWVDQAPIKKKNNQSIIAFHGAMTWQPNCTASIHLARDIFPLIKAKHSSAKLRIAGSPVFDELKKLETKPNVEIYGFVDDIRGWLAECDVYVMPMLQGSGVKNKLIEAMAAGLTVVTNSLGAEALPEEAKQGVIIADGEEKIANAVVYLLNNPEESLKLGKKARVMAEKYFRWETISQQLMTKIEEISQPINNV